MEIYKILLDEFIPIFYNYYQNQMFILENLELLERCIERADLIFEYQRIDEFIEIETIFDFNEWHKIYFLTSQRCETCTLSKKERGYQDLFCTYGNGMAYLGKSIRRFIDIRGCASHSEDKIHFKEGFESRSLGFL
jgi:hypothetical protein